MVITVSLSIPREQFGTAAQIGDVVAAKREGGGGNVGSNA